MDELGLGIFACALLIPVFLTGIEIAFGIGIIGLVGYTIISGPSAAFNLFAQDLFDTFSSYGLTVIPLFMLMGYIAFYAGIAQRVYDATYKLIGHIPGGLAMATVVAATLFKAMCGSTFATAATFSSVAVPLMSKYNYSKKLSSGVVASVGTIGILIPPSIFMIIYGIMTQQSIGELFLAGIVPGILLSVIFIAVIYVRCKLNPSLGPKSEVTYSLKQKLNNLPEFLSVVAIFLLVVGGLMSGIFVPTEAGSIGVFAVLMLALLRRSISFSNFCRAVDESLRGGIMVLMLIATSAIFAHFLAITEITRLAGSWLCELPLPKTAIIVIICLFYLIGGSFIDDLAFMILATPIVFPAILGLGYDPIWFGVMIGITIMVGSIIPPIAASVFIVKSITGESFATIYSGVVPFLLSFVAVGALLLIFPEIATWLPHMLMGM